MKILLSIFVLPFSLLANDAKDLNEFKLGKITNSTTSKESYFNRLGLPNVYVGTECPKKGDCWSVIRNQHAKVIKSFSTSDSVSTIARGRYADVAYLYYSYTYGPDKNRKIKYYLVNQKHKKYTTPKGSSGMLSIITKDRNLISVFKNGVYKNGEKILSNENIQTTAITNNPNGDIAIAAVLELSDEVIVTNLSKWKSTNIMLSKHGDRGGILAVYPKDNDNIYMAVYNNINIYNKGLMGAHVDFKTDKVEQGWIFNSSKRNIGFDPSIYISKNTLHLGAEDSTNRTNVHLVITPQDYKALGEETPKHIEGFEDESTIDLLVGLGASQTSWIASSSINDVNSDVEYGKVEYDIGKSLYKSIYFEGRFDSTSISLAYLQNEAENMGGITAKASKILNFLIDFDGLISDSSTLRLKVLKGNINGIATFVDNSNSSTSMTTRNQTSEFSSELLTYSAYMMGERGFYGGLEYTNYTTPSAVGFSNSSKSMELYGMDSNFKIDTYSFVIGYDEISYAKRYEVDLSRFYLQALAGIGWANYTLSSSVEQYVKNTTGKKINYTGSLTFNGELELGYIFQQRFKEAQGLGYAFTAGYKVRGAYIGSGQSDDSDYSIGDNELQLEMSRYDVWHGPFASANFIW